MTNSEQREVTSLQCILVGLSLRSREEGALPIAAASVFWDQETLGLRGFPWNIVTCEEWWWGSVPGHDEGNRYFWATYCVPGPGIATTY